MRDAVAESTFLGTEKIWKVLLRVAPPVMFAQLISALYNVVDSYFIGHYSADGLTALSVIFPIQLIVAAFSVGTGVGVNTLMSRLYAQEKGAEARHTAGTGMVLSLATWAVFSLFCLCLLKPYISATAQSPLAVEYAVTYGMIVGIGSLPQFLDGIWTKALQASGNMRRPMVAQIVGALVNIAFDPLLISGFGPVPAMGIAGAAIATVAGQVVAACIVGVKAFHLPPCFAQIRQYAKQIYQLGYPSICMQMLYVIYISILNFILASFSDEAITVLGLYYKAQTFFFIPVLGLQTAIVPVLSYNFTRASYSRCREVVKDGCVMALVMMVIGIVFFEFFPREVLSIFGAGPKVLEIGIPAFRIIGTCFLSAVFSLVTPVFFQAIGASRTSVLLSCTRQLFCLVPLFYLFSRIGLAYCWLAFPLSETITGAVGMMLYFKKSREWKTLESAKIKSAL